MGPERRLVDEAGRAGMEVQQAGVGGGPPTVRAAHHVGGEDVGVQLGVPVPRGAVDEGGRHQSRGLDPALAVVPAASHGGVALEVGQPFGDRLSWAARTAAEVSESLSPHSTETDLGDEKVRSNPDTRDEPPRRAASGEPSWRRDPGEDRPEVVGGDFPTEPEGLGPTPHPLPRGLTGAGVVLLFALGHDAQVVVLRAGDHLADGEHDVPDSIRVWGVRSTMANRAALGTTMRRPSRMTGSSPRATSS